MTQRFLIVNADDFGLSPGVNLGVIEAHERGIVTSASLMVRHQGAGEAAAYARAHPELSVGLHVDLGEWAFRDGNWVQLYPVVPLDDATAVLGEVERQVESFEQLVGELPTHVDSHQHVHRWEPVRSIVMGVAARCGVPLRNCTPAVRYSGAFYGQTDKGEPMPHAISLSAMLEILSQIPTGITEMGCHPGDGTDRDTMYRQERAAEVHVLCDSRVRSAIAAATIELCSFRDVRIGALGTLAADA